MEIALAGNPNVGKSTVFNALTGLHQHTGNWPGKTVENKTGTFTVAGEIFSITDVPGAYSLEAHSPEEEVAASYLLSGKIDCTVVVCDGGTLSRNLILVLQLLAVRGKCVVCVNLMDEAEKRGIQVYGETLSQILGCPVVLCAARENRGMEELQRAMRDMAHAPETTGRAFPAYGDTIPAQAEAIAAKCVVADCAPDKRDRLLDRVCAGKYTAYPIMALLLLFIFWLTIRGAGYLSDGLGILVSHILTETASLFSKMPWHPAITSFLCDGVLGTLGQVVVVMLPPMAVFFPLFTLLEDSGYLPRAAYNLDRAFRGCGACGKQALTMMMSFGCNAAGVTGCRIIDSPRERLLAILTCSFLPCNGRFPTLLLLLSALSAMAMGKMGSGEGMQTLLFFLVILLCTAVTLLFCRWLSATVLRGTPSSFALELPPYRMPRVGQVLVRSLLDRTVFVLGRAVAVAAPAGGVLWVLSHICPDGISLYTRITTILEPVGRFAGMDGVILTAFLFSLPAAEIFLPLLCMGYSGARLPDFSIAAVSDSFAGWGWTGTTLCCVLLFTLFHWPCSTTILTIQKETGSFRWTALSVLLPTVFGYLLCALVHAAACLF